MRVFWLEALPWDRTAGAAVTVRACNVALSAVTFINGAPPFLEVLQDGPTVSTVVFDGTFTGRTNTTFGTIPLEAGQGDIDYWAALAWSDRPVKIWTAIVEDASAVPAWGDLELIWDGVAETFKGGLSRATITLRVARPSGKLASGTYAGTGGVEGRVEITGAVKPYAAGVLLNRPAKLLDSGLGLYQVHGYGAVESFGLFREGYQMLDQTRVAQSTRAALLSATVPATEIHTFAAEGLFRIGFQPISDITADFGGANSGGFSARPGALIKRALLQVGWPIGKINTSSLDAIDTALPYDGQLYDDAGADIGDVLDQFCRDIGGYWDVTELGVFYAGLVTRQTPTISIGPAGQLRDYDIFDIDQLATQAPFHRNRVGYAFNPRVFSQAELGVAVAATTAVWSAVADDGGKPADNADVTAAALADDSLTIGTAAPITLGDLIDAATTANMSPVAPKVINALGASAVLEVLIPAGATRYFESQVYFNLTSGVRTLSCPLEARIGTGSWSGIGSQVDSSDSGPATLYATASGSVTNSATVPVNYQVRAFVSVTGSTGGTIDATKSYVGPG